MLFRRGVGEAVHGPSTIGGRLAKGVEVVLPRNRRGSQILRHLEQHGLVRREDVVGQIKPAGIDHLEIHDALLVAVLYLDFLAFSQSPSGYILLKVLPGSFFLSHNFSFM